MRLASAISLAALAATLGCAGTPYRVTRVIGGERVPGRYVASRTYEAFLRAELAFAAEDWAAAARGYQEARAGASDDPYLVARHADALDRGGREQAALSVLADGERLDPEDPTVWLVRGQIAERRGRLPEAEEAYAAAVTRGPGRAGPSLALARLLERTGRAEEALAVLERLGARAESVDARRAELALATARGDAVAVAAAVRALLSQAPGTADEIAEASDAVLERGHPELALQIASALPDRPALRLRAAIEARDDDAIASILDALPETVDDRLLLARAALALGRLPEAEELARVALHEGAGAEAHLLLARALRGRRVAEAAEQLRRIEAGTSTSTASSALLAEMLEEGGLAGLAAELRAR
jgi:tetratricopeptide (TPR) repeat protein